MLQEMANEADCQALLETVQAGPTLIHDVGPRGPALQLKRRLRAEMMARNYRSMNSNNTPQGSASWDRQGAVLAACGGSIALEASVMAGTGCSITRKVGSYVHCNLQLLKTYWKEVQAAFKHGFRPGLLKALQVLGVPTKYLSTVLNSPGAELAEQSYRSSCGGPLTSAATFSATFCGAAAIQTVATLVIDICKSIFYCRQAASATEEIQASFYKAKLAETWSFDSMLAKTFPILAGAAATASGWGIVPLLIGQVLVMMGVEKIVAAKQRSGQGWLGYLLSWLWGSTSADSVRMAWAEPDPKNPGQPLMGKDGQPVLVALDPDDDLAVFECPISLWLMVDPVITRRGHLYERAFLDGLFREADRIGVPPRCPMTRDALSWAHVYPCPEVKALIEEQALQNGWVLCEV